MTKTEIALSAIRGMKVKAALHIDIMEMMRTLKLTSAEATELRRMVGREWSALVKDGAFLSDEGSVMSLAKDVVNSYARNVSYR